MPQGQQHARAMLHTEHKPPFRPGVITPAFRVYPHRCALCPLCAPFRGAVRLFALSPNGGPRMCAAGVCRPGRFARKGRGRFAWRRRRACSAATHSAARCHSASMFGEAVRCAGLPQRRRTDGRFLRSAGVFAHTTIPHTPPTPSFPLFGLEAREGVFSGCHLRSSGHTWPAGRKRAARRCNSTMCGRWEIG